MVQQRILTASGVNQFVFNCTPKTKEFLLREELDPKYGARHLKRSIERNIVFPLANLVATGQVKLGDFCPYRCHRGEPLDLRQRSRGRHGSGLARTLLRRGDRNKCCGNSRSTSSSGPQGVWSYGKAISGSV